MERCRKADEKQEKERVTEMLKLKVIVATDKTEVGPRGSLAVISQTFTAKDGKVDIVAEYRALELTSASVVDEMKETYTGKVVGDVVELNLPDGILRTTILEIYKYVEVYATGGAEKVEETTKAVPDAPNPTNP